MSDDKTRKTRNSPRARAARSVVDVSLTERVAQLGIPEHEMTDAVSLAVTALLERMDDITLELNTVRAEYDNLERMVDVDCLVPVPNRRAFMRRLNWALSMHKRYGHPCSIVYFDLNGFKAINDTFSHAAGDEVIRNVAHVLTQSMRSSDYMARLGGDEFVVLLYHAKLDAARRRASVIAKRIADSTCMWDNQELAVSASYGTYEVASEDTAEVALNKADKAMYEHKKALQS